MTTRLGLSLLLLLTPLAFAATPIQNWGDQGNGNYKNPILKSDFSDPDVIRVGPDFYLIASDFNYVGMQVLHSNDLVNWQIISQVFDKLTMDPKYDRMAGYGEGTWAPSIRYHNGQFYIYVCTPHDGLFMWHATNPAGPWSPTLTVKKVDQWEDPCPFWDDDGQAYLIHSHKGAGPLIIHKMSPDGTTLLDDGITVYQNKGAEGPKLYKRHGYYYISCPEGGVATGGQTILRASNIYGPYQRRQVFPNGSPHQGGIVELPTGQAWFISFKSTGFLGRVCYLNPVTWTPDDWPVFGDHGQPVDVWPKPDVGGVYPIALPQTSDEFAAPSLNLIWQWNHNPIPGDWSLAARPGWLRLTASPAASLPVARNTLTQKLWDTHGTVDTKMDVSALADGQSAGFTFISGNTFGWIGVTQDHRTRRIAWSAGQGPPLSGNEIYLRGVYNDDKATLFYSLDGRDYLDTATTFKLKFAFWKGARVGLFSFGPGGGSADFDYFRYRHGDTTP